MFDAIAPRYDLVNRVMTFRLDVRWRRRPSRSLRPRRPARSSLDLASGTGDLCVELAAAGTCARCRSTCPSGCCTPTAAGAPGAGRHPAPARARRRGRRGHLRLRPAQPRRARAVLRRAGRGSCGRAGASRCSTSPRRRTRCCGWGHGIYFGRVVPADRRAAVRPGRLPLPAEAAWPTCPTAGRDARRGSVGRVRRRPARACCRGGITQLSPATGHDGMRAVTRPPRAATSTSTASPAATATCSSATGSGWPGGASRRGSPLADVARGAGRHRARRRRRAARLRPGSPRCAALPARRRRRAGRSPPSSSARGRTATRWITTIDGADARPGVPAPAAADRAGAFSVAPGVARRDATSPRSSAGRDAVRAGRLTKVVHRPRHPRGGRPSPSTCTPSSCACGRPSGPATATRSRASSAPRPSCWSPATATSCGPTRWPARRPAPATRPRTPRSPPRSSPRPRTRSSTASSSTSCTRRSCPWCSYLDWEAEPSIVDGRQRAAPRHAHRGPAVVAGAERARAGPGAVAHAGPRRPSPGRGARRSSPRSRASSGAATAARSAGSTRPATARGRWPSAAPRSTGATARLFAGGGIVADSEPSAELAETQAKFQAMLSAIIRP